MPQSGGDLASFRVQAFTSIVVAMNQNHIPLQNPGNDSSRSLPLSKLMKPHQRGSDICYLFKAHVNIHIYIHTSSLKNQPQNYQNTTSTAFFQKNKTAEFHPTSAFSDRNHYMTPTQTTHYYRENPSKSPFIFHSLVPGT